MKSMFIRIHSWFTACLLLACLNATAADPITDALQKGLFEEEANHNFEAAIKAYQGVIDQTAEQRKLAATAVFRLGECYRKLNKTNEAVGQYQRILREYSDVSALATLSQQNLAALGVNAAKGSGTTAATSDEAEEIEKIKAMIKYSPDLVNAPNPSGMTPLSKAAMSDYLAVARFLLDNKANVDARDLDRSTPLHRATDTGHRAMAELLLDRGADVNAKGNNDNQPLHLAAAKGYQSVLELLLSRKADVNGKGQSGYTPLHTALKEKHLEIAKTLLTSGADLNAQDGYGSTALHHAVDGSHEMPGAIQAVLSYKPDLDVQNRDGYTPLAVAAYKSGVDLRDMELLLQAGADVNAGTAMTPLLAAVRNLNPPKVRFLLEHKADPNRSANGETPGGFLINKGNVSSSDQPKKVEIAELLGKSGAKEDLTDVTADRLLLQAARLRRSAVVPARDAQELEIERLQGIIKESPDRINARDGTGQTPLHRAAMGGQLKVVSFLLTNKAEINIKDNKGSTPLHKAIVRDYKEMTELLLANGADVNAVGTEDNDSPDVPTLFSCQPLHMAAGRGNQSIAQVLIAAKADVNGRDHHERTPLHFAVHGGYLEMVRLLISSGGDPNIPDERGRTPAMLALAADFQNILNFLLQEGIYINAQDIQGNTLLHQSAAQRPPRMMQAILSRRPDMEIENNDGYTPLMASLSSQNVGAARALVTAGADRNHRNARGYFPLLLAAANANKEAVELLLGAGVDVNQKNAQNYTALSYVLEITRTAAAYRQKPLREIAELLRQHGAKEEVSSAKAAN